MFRNVAFGAIDFTEAEQTIELLNQKSEFEASYVFCPKPSVINEFYSSNITDPKLWKDKLSSSGVTAWEQCVIAKIKRTIAIASDANLIAQIESPNSLLQEVEEFKRYYLLKRGLDGLYTEYADNEFYLLIAGSKNNWFMLINALGNEVQARIKKESAYASLLQSQVKTEISTDRLDFYNDVAPKYGALIVDDKEKIQVREFFLYDQPEAWTLKSATAISNIMRKSGFPKEVLQRFWVMLIPFFATGGTLNKPLDFSFDFVKRFPEDLRKQEEYVLNRLDPFLNENGKMLLKQYTEFSTSRSDIIYPAGAMTQIMYAPLSQDKMEWGMVLYSNMMRELGTAVIKAMNSALSGLFPAQEEKIPVMSTVDQVSGKIIYTSPVTPPDASIGKKKIDTKTLLVFGVIGLAYLMSGIGLEKGTARR